MINKRATPEELSREAEAWADGTNTLAGWEDAPNAVPRHGESTAISIRMPKKMLAILHEFARRKGIGYQVLMKRWLEDRIREEAKPHLERLREQRRRAVRTLEADLIKHRPTELKLNSKRQSPVFGPPKTNSSLVAAN